MVQDTGYMVRIRDTEYMVQDKGLHDAGLRIQDAVFRIQDT